MLKKQSVFVPVKRILNIINSCETDKQLKNCLKLIENYVNQVKYQGISNPETLKKRLLKEYKQKKFQLRMISAYVRKHKKEHKKEFALVFKLAV